MTKWGIVSTILAEPQDVLRFAAYHLEAGAHRLFLFLDAENSAFDQLKAHPKIRPNLCNTAHWAKLIGKRPGKHQARQTLNATYAYHRSGSDVDWLAHIDVDEFLVGPVTDTLARQRTDQRALRVRPMENLGGSVSDFKAWIPPGPQRDALVEQIYPTYGAHLKGGFLSHVAGKVFARTGLEDITFKIHDLFQNDDRMPGTEDADALSLAHLHAKSWETWQAHYSYRLRKGSYRPELQPNRPRTQGGMTMNELFQFIQDTEGEAGLRAFFAEVAENTPELRARLSAHGMLRHHDLQLDAAVAKHFPTA